MFDSSIGYVRNHVNRKETTMIQIKKPVVGITERGDAVRQLCAQFPDITFETCAEKYLTGPNILQKGCVSDTDLARCGIQRTGNMAQNPQNRNGCLCLSGKKELLECPWPCANGCLYCYWKDKNTPS